MMSHPLVSMLGVLWQPMAQQQPGKPMPAWGNRAQEVFSGWQNTNEVFPVKSLAVILVVVLVILAVVWFKQWRANRPKDPPAHVVFRRLCRELELGLADRWLLARVAKFHQLPTPLTLLVSPGTLTSCFDAYQQSLPAMRKSVEAKRVSEIFRKLFGSQEQAQQEMLHLMSQMDSAQAASSAS